MAAIDLPPAHFTARIAAIAAPTLQSPSQRRPAAAGAPIQRGVTPMKTQSGISLLLVLAAGTLLAAPAHAALPPGISGAWYNPAQSGHGLSIKIIAPDRALVFWYAYDLEGNPFNLYIDGRVEGRRIEATALAPRGMRFGSFDPDELQMPAWGGISIELDDCYRGRLSWDADDPAFGSGSIDIVRLVGIDGQECGFGEPGPLAGGLYEVDVTALLTGTVPLQPRTGSGIAAVDPDGTVWGFEFIGGGADSREKVPGPTSFDLNRQVIQARFDGPADLVVVDASLNSWANVPLAVLGPVRGRWVATSGDQLIYPGQRIHDVTWTFRPSAAALVQPLTAARLAGDYTLPLNGQLAPTPAAFDVGADGSLCLRFLIGPDQDRCRLAGRYWLVDGQAGFFEFALRGDEAIRAADRVYRGRGWLQNDAEGEAIVLVGSDGHSGFGLFAR